MTRTTSVLANLGWDEVRLPAPVFEDDTIYARSKVLEARPSVSRPEVTPPPEEWTC